MYALKMSDSDSVCKVLKLDTIQCTEEVPTIEPATDLGNGYACMSEKLERVCVCLCSGDGVGGGGQCACQSCHSITTE